MNAISTNDLPAFLRKYRLVGGRIRHVRMLYPRPKDVAVEFHFTAHEVAKSLGTDPRKVRVVLRLDGVEEFRFQMRPNQPKAKIADARISYLKVLFYVSLDSLGLDSSEAAQVFDFRASEVYAAGRELLWEERPREKTNGEANAYNARMKHLNELYATVAHRVKPPVCVVLGPPWPAANLVKAIGGVSTTCAQLDLHQTERLRECLEEVGTTAEVVAVADLWDLPQKFNTVIFPASAHADRELKLDMVEQGYHILAPGGLFLTLSEYEKDNQFAKWQKKIYGKCGETPASELGMAFFSTKTDDDPERRRHEMTFHAKIGDGTSMHFISRPGTFGYGRFDNGSRAMLEIADIRAGDNILDLGCGNGAVGCLAAEKAGPKGRVTFIDSSLRAVALAELNAKANDTPNPKFMTATRLEGLGMSEFDVILANPPYYAKSEITRLFVEGTRDLLKRGGRYYIVTKMPTAVVPMIFQTYGDCSVIENRGYSVVIAEV